MRGLTLDDIIPLSDYAGQRREHFAAHCRYLDHYRRVRIGPKLTLVFENRQTLWFRVQELLRVARLAEPDRVQHELDLYNRLLPSRDRLQAALLIDIHQEAKLTEELALWQMLGGETLRMRIRDLSIPSKLITSRPEDRCIGASHWVHFHIAAETRKLLADFRQPVVFAVADSAYPHESGTLSDDVRQSLLDDLELSDRD
jgi:Protein of unknown function (DUF3501)